MMKNKLYTLGILLLSLLFTSNLRAQNNFLLPYQAVARSMQGEVMANMPIEVKVSLVSLLDVKEVAYQEVHYLTTDERGYFNLLIGNGRSLTSDYSDVNFGKSILSVAIEIKGSGQEQLYLLNQQELRSVPYAFHAQSTENIPSAALRSQSIIWTTSGNNKTRPPIHFIGTRDAQDFVIKTDSTTRSIVTSEGQVQIYSGVSGPEDDKASYPLTVEGSEQGIYIQVTAETPMNPNNFMTFANAGGETVGRIEGQTWEELQETDEYKNEIFQFSLEVVALTADAAGIAIEIAGYATAASTAGASVFFAWQVPGWVTAGAGAAAQAVALAANIVALEDAWSEFVRLSRENAGVSYESGSGDYAEWLPKLDMRDDLLPGEIIGIKAGKISRNTFGADHLMVVSTNPIILGNAPEERERLAYEKVAFMGQVPVKVRGAVAIGDYILPSGKNDGFGVAISPADLPARRHKEIIGTAWTAAEAAPVNFVNVAVGLQHNDLADEVQDLSDRVDALIKRVGLEDHPALQSPSTGENSTRRYDMDSYAHSLAKQYLDIIQSQAMPVWQKNNP